jgi:hypothetical protein
LLDSVLLIEVRNISTLFSSADHFHTKLNTTSV